MCATNVSERTSRARARTRGPRTRRSALVDPRPAVRIEIADPGAVGGRDGSGDRAVGASSARTWRARAAVLRTSRRAADRLTIAGRALSLRRRARWSPAVASASSSVAICSSVPCCSATSVFGAQLPRVAVSRRAQPLCRATPSESAAGSSIPIRASVAISGVPARALPKIRTSSSASVRPAARAPAAWSIRANTVSPPASIAPISARHRVGVAERAAPDVHGRDCAWSAREGDSLGSRAGSAPGDAGGDAVKDSSSSERGGGAVVGPQVVDADAVSIGTFMLLLDITIVNVALPRIQAGLHSQLHRPAVGDRRVCTDARGAAADRRVARRQGGPAG